MSTETRLTALEAAVAQLQREMMNKPSLGSVKTIIQAAETRLDSIEDNQTTYNNSINALNRYFTSIRAAIQGLNEDGTVVANNLSASTAPTTGDDSGDGYSIGSLWIDTSGDDGYICLDATSAAAVWKQITP